MIGASNPQPCLDPLVRVAVASAIGSLGGRAIPMRITRVLVALLVGLAGWLAWSPPAAAQSGQLILASTSDTGVKANRRSFNAWLSADGTKVAFTSEATNLDPADRDSYADVYVKDLVTGDITLASTSDEGVIGNNGSGGPVVSLSADGTKVAFASGATNLDPQDTDETGDLYVKDLVTGDITLVSTSDEGVKGNDTSELPILSADGTRVGFTSYATNLDPVDTDSEPDAYVKDLVTGDLVLASVSKTGVKANGQVGAISSTGQKVVLASNRFPRDTDPIEDVYLKNLITGAVRLVSTSDTGVKGNGGSFPTSLADGKVEFSSYATHLDPADTEGHPDMYVKDLVTGDLTLVSGSDPSLPGKDGDARGGALSADGVLATFSTQANNVGAADRDHGSDVWVRNLTTGALTLVSATAEGIKGNDDSFAYWGSISADGSEVAFESRATNLDPLDSDSKRDIYVKFLA
jgi:hypothetical protein